MLSTGKTDLWGEVKWSVMDKMTKRQFLEDDLKRLSEVYDKNFDKICANLKAGNKSKVRFYQKWEARLNDVDLRIRHDLKILQKDPCILVRGDNHAIDRYPECKGCTVECKIKNVSFCDEQVDFSENVWYNSVINGAKCSESEDLE